MKKNVNWKCTNCCYYIHIFYKYQCLEVHQRCLLLWLFLLYQFTTKYIWYSNSMSFYQSFRHWFWKLQNIESKALNLGSTSKLTQKQQKSKRRKLCWQFCSKINQPWFMLAWFEHYIAGTLFNKVPFRIVRYDW